MEHRENIGQIQNNSVNKLVPGEYDIRALVPGTVLNGQYTINSVIGQGGFGITYEGFDNYLKMKVAIKEYFPAQLATRNAANGNCRISIIGGEAAEMYDKGLIDFENEAHRLTQFGDLPGIVTVYNFFYANETAYMVMEFVEGITLKSFLANNGGKLSWQETLDMMKYVISSLKKVHETGLIHRDISPDNIIISADNKITIIDFGAARAYDDEKSRTVILKHGFAPPEQYFSNGRQGPWTDVYALCATMYRMITGIRLNDAMSRWDKKIKDEPIEKYASGIPVSIANAIMYGIEPDIGKRIASMYELEQYLYYDMRVQKNTRKKSPSLVLVAAIILVITLGIAILIGENASHIDSGSDVAVTEEVQNSAGDITPESQPEFESIEDKVIDEEILPDVIPDVFKNVVIPKVEYSVIGDGIQIEGISSNAVDIEIPATVDGKKVISVAKTNTNIVNLLIDNGIEKINKEAFKNCVYLENVYIPASVSVIEKGAFMNCISLKSITVSPNNRNYRVEGNVLISLDGIEVVSW